MADERTGRNTRDVVPELREHARLMRLAHPVRPGAEGRLLVDEIAANTIEALRARVLELERANG